MNIKLEPGKYVVAVSGGVDSVALLDHLVQTPNSKLQLVVAHFDHGIRPNSADDAKFVRDLAGQLGLPYESGVAQLGPHASEALARSYRYAFLRSVMAKHKARAIVTAHHQDDLIETALINLLRGTKYKGLYSLRSTAEIVRPLLVTSKKEILEYASQRNLEWREDETNRLDTYLRNRIRRLKEQHLNPNDRTAIIQHIQKLESLGDEIDRATTDMLELCTDDATLKRSAVTALPHIVTCELIAGFLRRAGVPFDEKTIERVVVDIKTKQIGKVISLPEGAQFVVEKYQIRMQRVSSV